MKTPVYLDYQATTPVDPAVLEAMLPYFREKFGNAASRNHSYGWVAEKAVEIAREQVAAVVGANAKEIVFTSGATESDNIALKGAVEMYTSRGDHIVTVQTEHKAVLDTCKYLERSGRAQVTYLAPRKDGLVDLDALREAITDKTVLVAIMAANNEIGVIQPLAEIGALCREKGVLFFTDAAQAYGKIPLDVEAMNIDIMAISAHKIYGPKGVGALYVRRRRPRVRLAPLIHGGGHERGMRSGTLPVPLIVGLGKAAELCAAELEREAARETALRDKLWAGLQKELDYLHLNGHPTQRLPGNLNVSFEFVEGEGLMMAMKELAVSSGSACTSASLEPSYVLKALGVGDDLAHTSIRYGIGRYTTEEEIDFAIAKTVEAVQKLREMSPLYEMAKEGIDLNSIEWTVH
ncbi:MAG: IscS subfamily cysteine desulfurase [Planctomycetota bacterium]|nr:MAG: IscS subfamily cysteine desulfurase [Planctomycetota bacterium]